MVKGKRLLVICAFALVAALAAPHVALAAEGAETLAVGVPVAADAVANTGKAKHVSNGVYYLRSASSPKVALCDPKASRSKGVQMRSAKAQAAASQKFYVRNEGSGLVSLQSVASGLFLGASGGRVVQRGDSGGDDMLWRVLSDGGLKFANAESGQVLSLAGGKASAGKAAITAADVANASQRWKLVSAKLVSNGYYRVKSAFGTYLDVARGSCAYDANVMTWSRTEVGAQTFHIYAKSGGYYCIENAKSFLLVGAKGASKASGANVVQREKAATAGNLWKPQLTRSGKLVFMNRKSGKALTVAQSSGKRGSNVRQNRATGARTQLWTLEKVGKYSLSGNATLDKRVATILRTHIDLRSAYNWVVHHAYREGQRYYSNPHVLPDTRTISLANDFIAHGSGNCYRFACTFSWLARGLGYSTRVISGWVAAAGGGSAPHGWVEVDVGGRTYVCDPDLQHELPAYNWFMTTYGTSPTAYHSW